MNQTNPEGNAAVDSLPQDFDREMERCWPLAQQYWSRFLLLSDPVADPTQASIAQIHLGTRQVSVNSKTVHEKQLFDCLEALLAHEVGHHVRYPGTLAVDARMRLLERNLLPFESYSVINLFTDLMINEFLGRQLAGQLTKVYQAFTSAPAFHAQQGWHRDPGFLFYLSLYEVLWRLPAGAIMGPAEEQFRQHFPGYRAQSQLLVQNLFALEPNIYTQFLYFVSIILGYLQPIRQPLPTAIDPCQCGAGEPSAEDWANALLPTAAEQEAIRRAIANGWFNARQTERLTNLEKLEERIAALPGVGTDDAHLVPEIMAAYYRQKAEQYLLHPPPQRRMGEAIVPTTHEDWELGDSTTEIDWLGTFLQRGESLGRAQPLRRVTAAEEEGVDTPIWNPRVEIYLDVSGSMPDPRSSLNAMTLAAQILTLGAVRSGGAVRAALYSSDPVLYWQWCRSETEISRFLMHYIGAGTMFPFPLLGRSIAECRSDQPIRIVITDSDFDSNYDASPEHPSIFAEAARVSPHFVQLLHRPQPARVGHYRSQGATVIEVGDFEDFPRMATQLALALFPDDPRHGSFQATS